MVSEAVSVKVVSKTSAGVLKVPVYELSMGSAPALAGSMQTTESRNPHFKNTPEMCVCFILYLRS
jgi:hypothetical protein